MKQIKEAVLAFIDINRPVRNGTLQNEILTRDIKINALEVYATLLEQHVNSEEVKQITGKNISDAELAAKVIVLGSYTTLSDMTLDSVSQSIVVHPKAENVIISGVKFLKARSKT